MKSRLAIIAILAVGMVFSTAGAGMAISGLSGSGDAGVAQYGTPEPTPTPTPPVETPTPTPTPEVTPTATPEGAVAPATVTKDPVKKKAATAEPADVQPAAQVEAGTTENELPFTGFAAIPVLLVGGLLLAVGMVMRKRNTDDA